MAGQLRAMFRYGWIAGEEERAGYVERVVADAGPDSPDAVPISGCFAR
jgi:hypothetical protein